MKKTTQRIVILVSLFAVIALFALFLKDILVPYIRMEIAHDLDGAKELLASKGVLGFFTVVLVEALQMVVVFIPAEFIQISSGMSYPFYIALLLCDLGVCLGASIIYVLVHAFGFSSGAAERNEEKILRLAKGSKKERSTVLLLYFLFIMPLIPFGAICYYGSHTKIRYPRYILTVATGVIPSIITSNLMGEATKYFIGNSLPLPLLILIIALLAAVLFILLFLFLDKVYFKENDGTPDSVVWAAFYRLAELLRGRKQKLITDAQKAEGLEPPFIILCNHESFYDFYYIRKLFPKINPALVVNRHIVSSPVIRKLAKKAGFIPKRLFNVDFTTPRGIIRAVKGGYSVAVFPEGRLSLTGREYPIVEKSGGFYKKLGLPIAVCGIRGAYFCNPKWRKSFYRGEISVSVKRVITKEEVASLSAPELDRIMEEELRYDESEARANLYPNRKDLAEGLENVLYRCADCGALYKTEGRGR
ncbi:MAG: VTT domain-containing protein, partial [Clostridia bacterium]|nr:VTT domain-containing protein [Clostridia bacterium]